MKTRAVKFLLILVLCLPSRAAIGEELSNVRAFPVNLVKKIPSRSSSVLTGSEFAKEVSGMDEPEREQAILAQMIKGNLPDFLRRLKPVRFVHKFGNAKTILATIFVTPDYLAIGSDRDFLSMPMNLYTATEIAVKLGFILPTKKMVDAIFEQSAFHFTPEPMPPGPQMRSTAYYSKHDQRIKEQRLAFCCPLDTLVSGHKKDVVLTNRLDREYTRVAIYGWHRPSGIPIQPLSTVHGANYADYSHGIRLVSETVLIGDEPQSIYGVLENPGLAGLLSDEGVIQGVRRLMTLRRPQSRSSGCIPPLQ